MTDSLSIAVPAFASRILMSLSVDETLHTYDNVKNVWVSMRWG